MRKCDQGAAALSTRIAYQQEVAKGREGKEAEAAMAAQGLLGR